MDDRVNLRFLPKITADQKSSGKKKRGNRKGEKNKLKYPAVQTILVPPTQRYANIYTRQLLASSESGVYKGRLRHIHLHGRLARILGGTSSANKQNTIIQKQQSTKDRINSIFRRMDCGAQRNWTTFENEAYTTGYWFDGMSYLF